MSLNTQKPAPSLAKRVMRSAREIAAESRASARPPMPPAFRRPTRASVFTNPSRPRETDAAHHWGASVAVEEVAHVSGIVAQLDDGGSAQGRLLEIESPVRRQPVADQRVLPASGTCALAEAESRGDRSSRAARSVSRLD